MSTRMYGAKRNKYTNCWNVHMSSCFYYNCGPENGNYRHYSWFKLRVFVFFLSRIHILIY